ncbi:hypothetical protein [Bacteroides finegoldii]|uniref:hypothetical protein n=2 Tax=Bacteroides finegoldii TaxID=338188 RepID=UPI0034A2AC7E
MAGMKFNADIDLEKIVKLRQEINKLKKSLIAVAGIPNSDAAIKQLESEIERATKKLSEYEDRYVKLQKIKYDIDSSNSTVKRVKEETFALRSTNKWIIANTESVKEADRQVKQLKKDFSALSDEEKVGDIGTAKIRQIQQLAAQRLVEEEAVRKTIKAQKDQIIQSNAEEGSITALRKQLILLIKDYDDLGRIRRGGDAGKALLTQISNVQKELNAAEQASGRFQRNVGNYASAFNGLGFSVQQVARELPSLAISANTFFLAISNNLPILVDEIAKAKKEYAAFKAELAAGNKDVKAVAPVWQQLTKSILSWQTALVVGLTLLSVYGKDVIKWIGSLGKAKDVTLDLLSAEQEMALARKSAWGNIAKEQSQLDILYNKLKNVTLSTTERNAAIREWVKNYKTHSDILDGEKVSIDKLKQSYAALSKEIYNKAVADKYSERAAELAVKIADARTKANYQLKDVLEAEAKSENAQREYEEKQRQYGNTDNYDEQQELLRFKMAASTAKNQLNSQQKIQEQLKKNLANLTDTYNVFIDQINKYQPFAAPKEGTYDYWQQQVEIADNALKQIQDSYLKVLKSGSTQGVPEEVVKQYDALIKQKTEAEEKLKIYDDKGLSKEYNSIVDQNQKISDLIDKQSIERKRREEDLENQVIQSRIDAMADGEAKIRAQRELDNKKEIQDLKRQREDYIRTEIEYQKRLFDAQEDLNAKKSKDYKKKTFDPSSVKVDTSNWDSIIENQEKKQIKDLYTAEANAMREYLKEYGTFQQKKEAITKEYNDKIANATTEGDKKILQKQMEEALSSVDMDKLKQEINWELIFSDLNKVSKKSLEQVKQQLKTFKNSDEYKNMAVDQKKVIDEALNNIQSTIIDKGGLLGDLPEQLDALRIAQDELKQAQDEYNKSLKSGTDAEKEAALKKKNKAEKNVQNAETNVTRSADKTYQNLITLADTITQLGSSSEMSLSQIGSLASGLIDTFTEAGSKIGGIVGAVFSLLDGIEKQGFDGFVKNVFSSVFGAGASMWNTITFGGFNKLFGIGGNAKEVQEAIDRLTDRNETLEKSIDRLTDVMEKSAGSKSISAYEQAYKYQQEQITNTLKIAQEQARYSGSHHSWQYYMEWTDEQLRWARENVDKNFSGTGSLWGLSPEQMKTLLSNADISEQIRNEGKGGYGGRVLEKLEAYADQAGKLDELTEKINESLMQISFDGLRDNFFESLMDMDKDAKSFSEDFSKYMQRALLNFSMGELFDDELRGWYNGIAKLMKEQGGKLTKQQLEDARKEYDVMVQDAMNERDKIAEITGYTGSSSSSSQEASKKVSASVTQDSIDEVSGRFTALQIAGEEIKNQNQQQTMSILELKAEMLPIIANTSGIKDIASETRDLLRLSYEAIVDIRDNTNVIVKPIQQMASDIAEVKRNTNGLSKR